MRPGIALSAALLACLTLTTCGPAATAKSCGAAQLSGTFSAIYGSAGAGSISYALRLRNRSGTTCFVSGLAGLRLLDRARRPLPTRVEPSFRGGPTAVRVVLRPGRLAKATARFSPDVPGPGEPVAGRRCERVAYHVRVTPPPAGGTVIAPVQPPTPVCEHGRMLVSALSPER